VAGVLDQTKPTDVPSYRFAREQYDNDAEFAARAERWLPHGSMVLQEPFVPFPEARPPGRTTHYDPLLPFLHSTTLRWSYGAMKGRYWDAWQARMDSLSIEDTLDAAAAAGFRAIYVDRNGYADRGASLDARLGTFGLARIESLNGRFWMYDIQPYAMRMQAKLAPEAFARGRDAVLHPLVLRWLPECSDEEGDAVRNWHWCGSRGGFVVENPSTQAQGIEIHGAVVPSTSGPCNLHIEAPDWVETLRLNSETPQPLAHNMAVQPGKSMIRFQSDCQQVRALPDPRTLVFRVDNFRATLSDAPPTPELTWGEGFYPLERRGSKTWHLFSASGELNFRNPGPANETVISMILGSSEPGPTPLLIGGPGFAESATIDQAGTVFSRRFLAPHGDSVIRFSTPAAPQGPRKLVFRVEDLRLGEPLLAPHLIQAN
jgi:hypothetical protein